MAPSITDSSATSEFGINVLQDIWIYDSECPAWLKLDYTISLRFGFSAHMHHSKLYLLGGAKNLMELSE